MAYQGFYEDPVMVKFIRDRTTEELDSWLADVEISLDTLCIPDYVNFKELASYEITRRVLVEEKTRRYNDSKR